MNTTETDERITAIEREMRQEDPALVATFERLGSFESDHEPGKRLLLLASAVVIATAIATMSPVAWMLSAVGLYAWLHWLADRIIRIDIGNVRIAERAHVDDALARTHGYPNRYTQVAAPPQEGAANASDVTSPAGGPRLIPARVWTGRR